MVDTQSPEVSLEGPPALTNDSTPSFKGSASEAGTVTVHVHKGATVSGNEVAKVTGPVSGGKWSAAAAGTGRRGIHGGGDELEPLGNEPGTSNTVTFVVDTAAPSLTLVGPPTRSSNTTPSFEGTTTEAGELTVHIHKGNASGDEVAHVTLPVSSGPWSSPAVSPGLAEGEYTAVATEPSSLGNGEGKSNAVTFEVVTAPPSVSLQKPVSPSKNTKPSFTGSTSEGGEVKVEI